MKVPELMPVLSAGGHSGPEEGACVMEMVSYLAGEEWSDSPACTHPVLASMARAVNDRLSDGERHALVPLIGRLFSGPPPPRTSMRLGCCRRGWRRGARGRYWIWSAVRSTVPLPSRRSWLLKAGAMGW